MKARIRLPCGVPVDGRGGVCAIERVRQSGGQQQGQQGGSQQGQQSGSSRTGRLAGRRRVNDLRVAAAGSQSGTMAGWPQTSGNRPR